jgi:Arc/MetJ family transcription regulator
MTKTTVIIDDQLLDEAMKVSRAKTKKQAITTALVELIRRKNLEALREEAGTYDLALSLEELQKLRNEQ